jgi:hypothetical protein
VAEPLIVEIPHRLGKEEAARRLKAGFGTVREQQAQLLTVHEEIWSEDRLSFRVEALKQVAAGTVDIRDNNVRVEVQLPWLLAGLAKGIQGKIQQTATLMLEKK